MNASAANALLKVLEEPPARSLFLIVSHAPGTAARRPSARAAGGSTCAPLSAEAIAAAIREHGGADADDDDLALAAALAEGSLRRAILLLEEGGIDTYRDLARLLAAAAGDRHRRRCTPSPTACRGRGDDDAYHGFLDLLRGWLEPPGARRSRAGRRAPLAAAAPGRAA